MSRNVGRNALRARRHARTRKRLVGTAQRPRLSVFRSLHHLYAQVIDDATGRTLVAASTREKDIAKGLKSFTALGAAERVGTVVAERAKEKGVTAVVFDRGGYKYHGRIKALADAARSAGLEL